MTGVRRAAATALSVLVTVTACSTEAELAGDSWVDPEEPAPATTAAAEPVVDDLFTCDPSHGADVPLGPAEQWMRPALADVRSRVAGLDGLFDVRARAPDAEIVVAWAAPVPDEVLALAAARPGRVRLVVEEVPYSRAEVDDALAAVRAAVREADLGVEATSSYACADGTGLVVGVAPDELGERREELQYQLAVTAGVPVLVTAQE